MLTANSYLLESFGGSRDCETFWRVGAQGVRSRM